MESNTNIIKPRDLWRNRHYFLKRLRLLPGAIANFRSLPNRSNSTLGDIITHNAKKYGNNTAILQGEQSITYRQLDQQANRIAHYLKSRGINKGDVVGLMMENRPEFIFYLIGISKAGAVSALVNTSQRGKVLSHSIDLVKAKTVIVGAECTTAVDEIKGDIKLEHELYFVPDKATFRDASGKKAGYVNIAAAAKKQPGEELILDIHPHGLDPAIFIYTSGTTGMPKATIQNNSKLLKLFVTGAMFNPMTSTDVMYCSLPLYHLTSLGACLMSTLSGGGAFVIARKFSASNFLIDINYYNVTVMGYVGELLRYLLNTPESAGDKQHSLHSIIGNGLKPELWMEFKNRFGIEEIRELYSASESNIGASNMFNIDETVGMVINPYAIVKFDTETEQAIKDDNGRLIKVAPGEQGLLLGKITKGTPFDGYTDPEKNKSKILNDVFKDGDRWFDSGDVVKDMGCRHIQFVDRTGDTYRWKGENVSTSEVEQVCNQFPEIKESIAYGVEIPKTNGRAGMLTVTLKEGAKDLNSKEFYNYIAKELPPYAVPVFVRINEELEVTGTFKYQKTGLKKEGFDISKVKAPIKVALPGQSEYVDLTADIKKKIEAAEYRF